MEKIILIDGNSILFRAYYAVKREQTLSTSFGFPTNALYGFINLLNGIIKNAKYVMIAFDTDSKTFRHQMDSEYKANRKEIEEDLVKQIPLVYEYLDLIKIKYVLLQGFEADDIIGSAAKYFSRNHLVEIYSSDRDLLQLINNNTTVTLLKKGMKEVKIYDQQKFEFEYQIKLSQFIDYKTIVGDSSDNIAGIPNIGPKGAKYLLNTYESIDNILGNLDSVTPKSYKEKILLVKDDISFIRKLVRIETDILLNLELDDLEIKPLMDNEKQALDSFYTKYELYSFLKSKSKTFIDKSLPNIKISLPTTHEKINNNSEFLIMISIIKKCEEISLYIFDCGDNYHYSSIVGFGITTKKGNYYFDYTSIFDYNLLNEIFSSGLIKKNVFNYKKTLILLNRIEMQLNGVVFDLMLGSYLIDNTIGKEKIEEITRHYNYDISSSNKDLFSEEDPYSIYSLAIHSLKKTIIDKLITDDQLLLHDDIELPLSNVLYKMESKGILVDTNELQRLKDEYERTISSLEKEIYLFANNQFNINSPKQLSVVLYDTLHLGKGIDHKYSTSHELLLKLKNEHPIIDLLIKYRETSKLLTTYILGVKSRLTSSNLIHTTYLQTLTNTGRLSSIDPNLQNIPTKTEYGREVKKIFISREGYSFIALDYSQIELRVLAHIGNVKSLINAFNNNQDIHSDTAKMIFNVESPSLDQRRQAKTINFAVLYGQGPFALANELNISTKEAKAFIDKYFQIYPEIQEYFETISNKVKNDLYVSTLLGRRRYINDINSTNKGLQAFALRAAINSPIQGTSADLIKLAMIKTNDFLVESNLDCYPILTIHDEIICECKNDIVNIVKDKLISIMSNAIKLKVPLQCSCDIGRTWYELV